MKKIKNISLSIMSILIYICSAVVFAGCNDDDDICKLFVFATTGGYVQVNNSEDYVRFGDEGSKFIFNEDEKVTLKAVPEDGYDFVKWEYTDDFDELEESFSFKPEISFVIDDNEVVIRAVFALNDSVSYTILYPTNTIGYTIVPEAGYDTNVVLGGEFKFKVNLEEDYSNSNIIVKVGTKVYAPDINGVYTITNITKDINITVEGVEKNAPDEPEVPQTYTIFEEDDKFSIVPVGVSSCIVNSGSSFTFRIELNSGYKYSDSVVVRANGVIINPTNNQYTINSVTENIEIKLEGIVEIPQTYTISTQDNKFTIIPIGTNSFEVEASTSFTFEIDLKPGYKYGNNVIVKANGTRIIPVNNQYTIISVIEDVEITVEGIEVDTPVIPGPVDICEITIPNSQYFSILDEYGVKIQNSCIEIEKGNTFKFKTEAINNGYTVVKVNDNRINPENGVYSFVVNENTVISVNVYYEMILPTSEDYTILHVDSSEDDYGNPTVLIENGIPMVLIYHQFEFKLNVNDVQTIDSIIIKGNGVELNPTNDGIYSIAVSSNIEFTIELIRKSTYTFILEFEDSLNWMEGVLLDIPESISFEVSKYDKTISNYMASEFIVDTSFGETISILELIEDINNIISNYGYTFSNSSSFVINGQQFISVNDSIMSINWELLNNNLSYVVTIVL